MNALARLAEGMTHGGMMSGLGTMSFGGVVRRVVWTMCVVALAGPAEARGQGRSELADLSPLTQSFVTVDAPTLVIQNVGVIDGTGAEARGHQTVVVTDGRIAAIGDVEEVRVPDGARVIDGSGKTLIPGLVGVHEHMFYPAGAGTYAQQNTSFPRLYLAGGVTTVRTGGGHMPYADLNLKAAIDAGTIPGPWMHVSSPYLEAAPGVGIWAMKLVEGPDDIRETVRYWAGQGVTSFKAFMHLSREELAATIDEAHQFGLTVTGHLCSVSYHDAATLGIDNLEHGFIVAPDFVEGRGSDECPSGGDARRALARVSPDDPEFAALVATLVDHGVALTSTLAVYEGLVPGRPMVRSDVLDLLADAPRRNYLQTWSQIARQTQSTWGPAFAREMEFERAFVEAGGLLAVGSDPTGAGGILAGFANQRSVILLVEAGFTVVEAIQIATLNGARVLRVESEVGSIEVGKRGDLVLLDGDLATDVEVIESVDEVFRWGVGFDPERLIESVRGLVGLR